MNEELYHELEIVVKATFFLDFLVSRCRTFGSDGFSELASGLFLFEIEICQNYRGLCLPNGHRLNSDDHRIYAPHFTKSDKNFEQVPFVFQVRVSLESFFLVLEKVVRRIRFPLLG